MYYRRAVSVSWTQEKVHFERLKTRGGGPTEFVELSTGNGEEVVVLIPEPKHSTEEILMTARNLQIARRTAV